MYYLSSLRNGVFLSLLLAILAIGCSKENKPVIPPGSDEPQIGKSQPSVTDDPKPKTLKPRPPRTGPIKTQNVMASVGDAKWGFWVGVKQGVKIGWSLNGLYKANDAAKLRFVKHLLKLSEPLHVGTLSYPAVLYGGRILSTQKLSEDFKEQYPDSDIQLIKIPVSYFPETPEDEDVVDWNKFLKGIDVTIEFFGNGDKNETPIQIIDHFPNTLFSETGETFDAHIGVRANGRFTAKKTANANFDANIGYQFTYKPLKASIISEGISNRARWKLSGINDNFPIGGKDYFVTVLIPRKSTSAKAKLTITLFLDRNTDRKSSFGPFPIDVEFGESR